MSGTSTQLSWSPSISSAGDSPARTSAWLGAVLDWLASVPDFGTNSIASLMASVPVGWWLRTSPVCFQAIAGGTLPSSFPGWSNSGMAVPGGFLTLNTSEWPSAAVVCSLSDVLETPGPQLRRYCLSPKAAIGILRRAERRGRTLPARLEAALMAVAATAKTTPTTS